MFERCRRRRFFVFVGGVFVFCWLFGRGNHFEFCKVLGCQFFNLGRLLGKLLKELLDSIGECFLLFPIDQGVLVRAGVVSIDAFVPAFKFFLDVCLSLIQCLAVLFDLFVDFFQEFVRGDFGWQEFGQLRIQLFHRRL